MTERGAAGQRIVFVTGKLAAAPLRRLVADLSQRVGFDGHVVDVKISVAALMTPAWLVGKLQLPPGTQRVILPGNCRGELDVLRASLGDVVVERGPGDLRDLPEFFAHPEQGQADYGNYDIEILAEINHANRLSLKELLHSAEDLRRDGANVIDLGCTPGERWNDIGSATAELVARGIHVSVDSFDPGEVADACAAGAELVLSVHRDNCQTARDWGREVVVIPQHPDEPSWLDELRATVEELERAGVQYRLDPVLAPIGFGFASSLGRYLDVRRLFPEAAVMMGIGNLTEMTAADSAGINALLVGFCQELGIASVLTTQVIAWARGSVREIAVARQLMRFAVSQAMVPKYVDSRLVMLRDVRIPPPDTERLRQLAQQVRDPNFRLFAEDGKITAFNNQRFEQSEDAFALFEQLGVTDPAHAFYLGWEMMKASAALQLGKRYVQDQPLAWGLLTREEAPHRDRRQRENRR